MQKIFLAGLALLLVGCFTTQQGGTGPRPSQFQVAQPVHFGNWVVHDCKLSFRARDFVLSTTAPKTRRDITFDLISQVDLAERPQVIFNNADLLIELEGSGRDFRFDIPLDESLIPQLYRSGSYLILTYQPRGVRTILQHFFPTKEAMDGLKFLAETC